MKPIAFTLLAAYSLCWGGYRKPATEARGLPINGVQALYGSPYGDRFGGLDYFDSPYGYKRQNDIPKVNGRYRGGTAPGRDRRNNDRQVTPDRDKRGNFRQVNQVRGYTGKSPQVVQKQGNEVSCTVTNNVVGYQNHVVGRQNKCFGTSNKIAGKQNHIEGRGNQIKGHGNKVVGQGNQVD